MAIVNLLFLFLGTLSRHFSWWNGITTRMKAMQLGGLIEIRLPLFNEYYNRVRSPRRDCTSDEIVEDIEMTMGV